MKEGILSRMLCRKGLAILIVIFVAIASVSILVQETTHEGTMVVNITRVDKVGDCVLVVFDDGQFELFGWMCGDSYDEYLKLFACEGKHVKIHWKEDVFDKSCKDLIRVEVIA